MPIMAARLYRNGQRIRDLEHDETIPEDCTDEFFWLGLYEPHPDELARIALRFGLHPLAVEDALKANQLPKVEVYGEQLFVITRTAHLEEGDIAQGETAIFVGPNFIVTVRHASARTHSQVREKLEANPARLSHGPDAALHGVIDYIVDRYFPVIDTIEEAVLDMEDRVTETSLDAAQIRHLLAQRHELIRFQRIIGMMKDVVGRLTTLDLPCIDEATRPFFRDILDHLARAEFRLTGLRDIMASVIETNGLLEQQRQGIITRQLAAWAAILAVPTAIAGIYGMNFVAMPELHWRAGYPLSIAFMASICTLLYWRFKRIGWL